METARNVFTLFSVILYSQGLSLERKAENRGRNVYNGIERRHTAAQREGLTPSAGEIDRHGAVEGVARPIVPRYDVKWHPTPGPSRPTVVDSVAEKMHDYQRYKDFYTGTGSHSESVMSVFDETAKKDNDQKWYKQARDVYANVQVMDRLWAAVNEGTLPATELMDYQDGGPRALNYANTVDPLLAQGSFLEIGPGATILHLANAHPNVTAVAVITGTQRDQLINSVWEVAETESLHNLYVGTLGTGDIPEVVETLYSDQQAMFGNLLVTNMTSLVGSLLPHEFQQLLARLIAMATQTFIIGGKLDSKHLGFFEQNWESVEELVKRSCAMANLACVVQDGGRRSSRIVGTRYHSWNSDGVVQVVVSQGTRQLPDTLCDVLRPHTQCMLEFGKASRNVTLAFKDNTEMTAPIDVHSVPLHIIMRLGATNETSSKILMGSLRLPYTPQTNMRSLVASGPDIKLQLTGENDLALDPYSESQSMHQEVAKLFGEEKKIINNDSHKKDQRSSLDVAKGIKRPKNQLRDQVRPASDTTVTEPGRLAAGAPHQTRAGPKPQPESDKDDTVAVDAAGSRIMVDASTERKSHLLKVLRQGQDAVANSQVDGVAQRWIRVEGDSPTLVQKDDQQFQSMGKHWDRENVDSLNGDDPLQAQENQELAKFDRAWEREQTEGDQEENHQLAPQRPNNDAILRRDEKELKRAMGFLHGESDLKQMGKMLTHRKVKASKYKVAMRQRGLTKAGHPKVSMSQTRTHAPGSILVDAVKAQNTPNARLKNDPQYAVLKFQRPKIKKLLVPDLDVSFERKTKEHNKELEEILKDDVEDENRNSHLLTDHDLPEDKHLEMYSKLLRDKTKRLSDKPVTFVFNQPVETQMVEAEDDLGVNGQQLPVEDAEETPDQEEYDDYHQQKALEHNQANRQHTSNMKRWRQTMAEQEDPGSKQKDGEVSQDLIHLASRVEPEDQEVGNRMVPQQQVYDEPEGPGEDTWKEDKDMKLREVIIDDAMEGVDQTRRRLLMVEELLAVPHNMKGALKMMPKKFHTSLRSIMSNTRPQGLGQKPEVETKGCDQDKHVSPVMENQKEPKVNVEVRKEASSQRTGVAVLDNPSTEKTPQGDKISQDHEDDDGDDSDNITPEQESEAAEGHQNLFGSADHQEALYDRHWRQLQPELLIDSATLQQTFSVFTYGGRSQSLVGLKIALTYPHSTVVSVMPAAARRPADHHRRVMRSVGTHSVLLLVRDLSPAVVDALSHSPDMFRYQVLGLEVYQWLLQLKMRFNLYLGKLLSMATTTFLEVPDPQLLCVLEMMLGSYKSPHHSHVSVFKGLIYDALRLVNAESSEVTLLDDTSLPSDLDATLKIVKVVLHTVQRQVKVECTSEVTLLSLRPDGSVLLQDEMTETDVQLAHGLRGFSLHMLLELGLQTQPKERARLFLSYLRLPLHPDMCPIHIVWIEGTLHYRPLLSHEDKQSILTPEDDTQQMSQATLQVLQDELDVEPFSFMEYYTSDGHVLKELARRFNNSTFLALMDGDLEKAKQLYQQTKEAKLANIAITNVKLNERFSHKLLKSPDFLRYQLIDYEGFLGMLTTLGSRQQFDLMLGQVLASGVTTFIQLPSDQMLSVAMATFFPRAYVGSPLPKPGGFNQMFGLGEHPSPVYRHAERRLIGESAKVDATLNISAIVIPPLPLPNGGQLPWKLVRVDVRNLTVEVDHHFDYKLDGHTRKYMLHCVSHNNTSFDVWLVRQKDGYHIPYGQLHVVTLIALLRMSLLEEIKTHLYDMFLQLPLYEDMAPWNIVFDAGRLAYIDYDSKDFTFNRIAPAAFQVIFMLLNYERTVRDFGHCKNNANVAYGINIVGKCVGSSFKGPCDDTRYPVPCGDHTCRASYIDCLQALQALENHRASKLDTVLHDLKEGDMSGRAAHSPFDSGHWSFGLHGVKGRRDYHQHAVHHPDEYMHQSDVK